MPKQVWQADDGSVFDSEEACEKYEAADVLLKHLFDPQDGKKINIGNYDELREELEYTWNQKINKAFTSDFDSSEIADILILFHKSSHVRDRFGLNRYANAMQKLGAYLGRA